MATLDELQAALIAADKAGATEDAQKLANAILAMRSSTPTVAPAAVQDPNAITVVPPEASIGRSLGLTARAGIEGLADTIQPITEPIRYFTDKLFNERPGLPKSTPLGVQAARFADYLGLPSPIGKTERVVQDTAKLMATTGGMSNLASAGAKVLGSGPLSAVLTGLTEAPVAQVTGALGAGLAGGATKESGGGFGPQLLASLAGGLAGGLTPSALTGTFSAVKPLFPQNRELLDTQLSKWLNSAGLDYETIPERARQVLRKDVEAAYASGKDLDVDALRRLAEFRAAGLTPTQGSITLNPVTITQEKNLAKMGANTKDPDLNALALTQNENNKKLITRLNEMGDLPPDLHAAGVTSIERIKAKDEAWQKHVSDLYEHAASLPGGDIQLARKPLIDSIYSKLSKDNAIDYLPEKISKVLDTISAGTITRNGQTYQVPFDVLALDNLMTRLATAQRGESDGNVKHALKLVRQAIDEMPTEVLHPTVGSNAPVTDALGQALASSDAAPDAVRAALNAARKEARLRFKWQDSTEPVKAALGGAEPDKYVKRLVIDGNAADVKALMHESDPQAIRASVLAYLKHKALNSAEDEVGTFSQSTYNKTLKALGDAKLKLIFEKPELDQLKLIGRVASYSQVQPSGSAVGNPNTGAYLAGKAFDWLKSKIIPIPGVGPVTAAAAEHLIARPAKGAASWKAQNDALNAGKALVLKNEASSVAPAIIPLSAVLANE